MPQKKAHKKLFLASHFMTMKHTEPYFLYPEGIISLLFMIFQLLYKSIKQQQHKNINFTALKVIEMYDRANYVIMTVNKFVCFQNFSLSLIKFIPFL